MDEKRIGEIVEKVYQKANESCVSDAKNALAIHVEDEIYKHHKKKISYRTVERAFERHVFKDKTVSERSPESINLLCKYLGYEDFHDYTKKNSSIGRPKEPEKPEGITGKQKWLKISISIVFGMILMIVGIQKWSANRQVNYSVQEKCMTWADSLYVTVSCDESPLSKYGTRVKPLDQMELKNMSKVEVHAAYKFFADDGSPLIWYYKKSSKEIEYFTAPGLHPTNGETLRKITPYIIQMYVPKHMNKKSSFVQ